MTHTVSKEHVHLRVSYNRETRASHSACGSTDEHAWAPSAVTCPTCLDMLRGTPETGARVIQVADLEAAMEAQEWGALGES